MVKKIYYCKNVDCTLNCERQLNNHHFSKEELKQIYSTNLKQYKQDDNCSLFMQLEQDEVSKVDEVDKVDKDKNDNENNINSSSTFTTDTSENREEEL